MTSPAGISGQLGFKTEASYGTGVTVDQFHPGFLDERVQRTRRDMKSRGIRADKAILTKWKPGVLELGGRVSLELFDEPLATLLTHMLGTVNTSGAGPYTHTATRGSLTGQGFTMQFGRPAIDETVHPFTYLGCKIATWEIAARLDEIARLQLEVIAQDETTGTALAAASYPTSAPFDFIEGSVSIGGAEVTTVKQVSLVGNNNLVRRPRIGSNKTNEPLQNGLVEVTGQLLADFESLTQLNRFYNADEDIALVLAFDNGTDTLTITTNVMLTGQTPNVAGPALLEQPIGFEAYHGTDDDQAISAVLVNAEASAA